MHPRQKARLTRGGGQDILQSTHVRISLDLLKGRGVKLAGVGVESVDREGLFHARGAVGAGAQAATMHLAHPIHVRSGIGDIDAIPERNDILPRDGVGRGSGGGQQRAQEERQVAEAGHGDC